MSPTPTTIAGKTTPNRGPEPGPGPTCVFVVGPRGAGKTRWIQQQIRQLAAGRPDFRAAVILAEDGHTRMERFAHDHPGVAVRRLLLPCPCCPALAQLPATVRDLVSSCGAGWLFLETPATAASGLLAEFDRDPAWPRRLVLCLDPRWARLCERPDRPYFLSALLDRVDEIVPPGALPAAASPGHGTIAQLALS